MLKRFANTAVKQAKAANKAQLMKYATAEEGKVTLSDEVKSHLKPEVLQIIESKSDYALIKKLNHLGKHGAVRLNTASRIQLVSINAQTVFKIVCFELEDPWVYYWTKVQDNGNNPQKWLASLKEVSNVPALVERCYRQMLLSNCYPHPEHYAELMKATAALGDIHSSSIIADDFTRCATSKIVKKPNPDMWKALLDTFINAKDYDLALLSKSQMEKKKVSPAPEQESKLAALKGKYDPKARGDFLSGKTQTKSQYDVDMDEQEKAFLSSAITQVNDFIQPPFEKLVFPDELNKRKAAENKV